MNCRHCNTPLKHVFVNLNYSPPCNSMLSEAQLNQPEVYYPLKIYVCHECFLVQVDEFKKADQIFNENYTYFSSYSNSWLEHCKFYTDMIVKRFNLNKKSKVIELASNDGYLLQYFKKKHIPVLGIEPAANTAQVAIDNGIDTMVDFFGEDFAQKRIAEDKADLIIGNNVLAHVPDINDFVKGMKIALKDNGVITMEFPHLLELIKWCQFDTIYHEHFSYLSFTTVKRVFNSHGLELFDVDKLPTHGGSLRIYARHLDDNTKPVTDSVKRLLLKEEQFGLNDLRSYSGFQQRVDKIKYNLLTFLIHAKKRGKMVIGYGAAGKGNTLLNYCGIKGNDLLSYVVDASPHKQGRYLPGSHIPVVNEEKIKIHKPDYVLILPWNLEDEIITQLDYVHDWGGKFLVPIPEVKVLESVSLYPA